MSAVAAPSLTLSDYLEKLQGTTFRKLYQQPSTAFAIFRRMLPHLGWFHLAGLHGMLEPDPRPCFARRIESEMENAWS